MKVAEIQFVSWDKGYFSALPDFPVEAGDRVIVKTDLFEDLGEIINIKEIDDKEVLAKDDSEDKQNVINDTVATDENISEEDNNNRKIKLSTIVRKATSHDWEKLPSIKDKNQAISFCAKMKNRHQLPMKIVDAHFSFDGSRLTFAFIADGRVDFRALVKDLTRHFNRTIRLQQIGIRDEARIMGDVGHCGQPLCCRSHLKELVSITSEMAELQECSHRGSDRISGVCGRLLCCLAYEEEGYEEIAKKMPEIGKKVSYKGQKGVVVARHILKRTIEVEFPSANGEPPNIIEINLQKERK